jgi:hypothetical protein
MAQSLFLPVGGTIDLAINYFYKHPDPGLAAPTGVTVASDNEGAATVALDKDCMGVLIKGVSAGVANIAVTRMGLSDVVEVTVADPQLSGLAFDSAHAVWGAPPAKRAAAPAKETDPAA